MKVRIPTPLRSYTDQASVVTAGGTTVSEVLDDLDRQFPGLRFRIADEQNHLRQHVKLWLDDTPTRDLTSPVADASELTIMQALSGG